MKKILFGAFIIVALCLSGCSDVGRYQLYNNGLLMIDTKTGDVYQFTSVFDKEINDYREYYKKLINETEANRIKFRNNQKAN